MIYTSGKIKLGKIVPLDIKFDLMCPECKEKVPINYKDDGLEYPLVGEEVDFEVWCPHCEYEWTAGTTKLTVTLEVDSTDIL